ncbi:sialidase-3 [Tachyglossus aculeatus]|uniref:sialidase-3 n=1 Tax=Tachyglossus aculeatus TaxID=9261 RepID=UPI0018F41673|nr:sialidase-3 [Tachyglossus aculeatus]
MEEADPGAANVPLFEQESVGGVTYRIPALLYIPPSRTLLAFAEKRSTAKDEDALHLVLRRGLRDGLSVQWGPAEPVTTARLPGHRTMNPCPVREWKSGELFLFFLCVRDRVSERRQMASGRSAARLCLVSSSDDGRHWGPPTDVTREALGPEAGRWATFAVGPGHGVQLQDGRLVVPAYAYGRRARCPCLPPAPACLPRPHAFVLYSIDLGATWRPGAPIRAAGTGECQVAEVAARGPAAGPVVLYCNARTGAGRRAEAFSADGGEHFGPPVLSRQLREPPRGCQGSVVGFHPGPADGEAAAAAATTATTARPPGGTWLVYSHPTGRKRRADLGVCLNRAPLEAGPWSRPWVLHRGPSGYSDLAVLEDGAGEEEGVFGCLFECGLRRECEQIAFRLFTGRQLLARVRPADD